MKEGDKVRSNGKYVDIQLKFGDTVQTVKYVGKIPSCKQDMVWLVGGGGCFMADGFTVVEEAGGKESDEVVALRKTVAAQADMLKRCAAFLGETIQCGVEGEMLDGRHVNVAASDLADDIDDLLKQRTEASHPDSKENEEVKIYKKYRLLDAKTGEEKHGKYFVLKIDAKDENERKCVEKAIEIYAVSHANRGNSEYANAVLDYLHGKIGEG